jgi:hypothetical protein
LTETDRAIDAIDRAVARLVESVGLARSLGAVEVDFDKIVDTIEEVATE